MIIFELIAFILLAIFFYLLIACIGAFIIFWVIYGLVALLDKIFGND